MKFRRNIDNVVNNAMKNGSTMLENVEKFDLNKTLELLCTTSDMEVQAKLFSILSAYVMLKDADTSLVITCSYVYDKLTNLMAKGTSRRAAVGLNFLSALLYVDEDRSKNLALYVKNMIRVSGCLATMSELFTSCVMYQDTWQALCRCLSEACRGTEVNQSYCTHLVPVCIQRCNQRNVEAFAVLVSLLQNHKRNIQLFIDSDGVALFIRDFLQYEACLELLAMLVQNSSQAITLISKSNVGHHLRDFLQLYGPQSQLGQWSTIILYHTSRLQEPSTTVKVNPTQKFQQLPSPVGDSHLQANDTTLLFRNVVNEILYWQPKNDFKDLKTFMQRSDELKIIENGDPKSTVQAQRNNSPHKYPVNNTPHSSSVKNLQPQQQMSNLHFSFLRWQNVHSNNKIADAHSQYYAKKKLEQNILKNASTQTYSYDLLQSFDLCEDRTQTFINLQESTDVQEFKPTFVSTPKNTPNCSKVAFRQTEYLNDSFPRKSIQKTFQSSQLKLRTKKAIDKRKSAQGLSKFDKGIKNRSISTRFMDAINESCTTLVNTVKSLFVSKNNMPESKDCGDNAVPSDYSFTSYMRKRDAVLVNEKFKNMNSGSDVVGSEVSSSCNTCNDTVTLKRKLANDDYLKHTVKKLKVGINLYGCDFKKISKTLWPQETYMTPCILYNLYRKLIIK